MRKIVDGIRIDANKSMELLIQYRENGDLSIRNKIVVGNIHLVKNMAKNYSKYTGIDTLELESFGYEGLIQGIENYDMAKNKSFTSYINKYIMGYIFRSLGSFYGFHKEKAFFMFNKFRSIVEQKYNTRIDLDSALLDEIVDCLYEYSDLSNDRIEDAKSIALLNMAESIYDHKQDINCVDNNSLYKEVIDPLYYQNLVITINDVLKHLSDRNKKIIELRFGLNGEKTHTLGEIAQLFGLTDEGVRIILKKELKKLSKSKKASKLHSYLDYSCFEYDFNPALEVNRSKTYRKKK